MGLEIFKAKELTAINALGTLKDGRGTANEVEQLTGLSARIIGQVYRHNEVYVRIRRMVGNNGRTNLYSLTNEGWNLIERKRGKVR